jgi:hypothetical protein
MNETSSESGTAFQSDAHQLITIVLILCAIVLVPVALIIFGKYLEARYNYTKSKINKRT